MLYSVVDNFSSSSVQLRSTTNKQAIFDTTSKALQCHLNGKEKSKEYARTVSHFSEGGILNQLIAAPQENVSARPQSERSRSKQRVHREAHDHFEVVAFNA